MQCLDLMSRLNCIIAAQIIHGLFRTHCGMSTSYGVQCKVVLKLASLTVPLVPVLNETSDNS